VHGFAGSAAADVALFGNGEEVTDMTQFHAIYGKAISERRDRYWTV
jgi:hypothetical protein